MSAHRPRRGIFGPVEGLVPDQEGLAGFGRGVRAEASGKLAGLLTLRRLVFRGKHGACAMHGLINRSIEVFLRDTYGAELWLTVAGDAALGFDSFEAMLSYEDRLTERVVTAAAARLDRPRESLLEDLGTYLVSHASLERLRRLLRFGGVTFVDFLHSLDDLEGRGRLALPELDLPSLHLRGVSADRFVLRCEAGLPGAGHVIVGLLRAMADDYGALVLIEHVGADDRGETVSIHLLETRFSAGRQFDLAVRQG